MREEIRLVERLTHITADDTALFVQNERSSANLFGNDSAQFRSSSQRSCEIQTHVDQHVKDLSFT
jgi:hypothetical protein